MKTDTRSVLIFGGATGIAHPNTACWDPSTRMVQTAQMLVFTNYRVEPTGSRLVSPGQK